MASLLARILLFVSSFFPLALIFFVLFVRRNTLVAALILALGLVGLAGIVLYVRAVQGLAAQQITVAEIQNRDGDAVNYLVAYVIPFVALPFQGWEIGIALTLFFVVVGILYVRSNMIHVNPMLNLLGYHLYAVTVEHGSSHALVTRHRIARGETLRVVKAGEDILWEKTP